MEIASLDCARLKQAKRVCQWEGPTDLQLSGGQDLRAAVWQVDEVGLGLLARWGVDPPNDPPLAVKPPHPLL
ncbi:hypothetical protein GCM10009850_111580 [Nonomuraea monospora]|uniref:Uncharacterized protein n=1 Tax=Nonomuraea monospora TaxID=568818 RepID=A0ABN3D1L5_9ACTN